MKYQDQQENAKIYLLLSIVITMLTTAVLSNPDGLQVVASSIAIAITNLFHHLAN